MIVAGLIFVMAGAIGWLLVAWLDAKGTLTVSRESVLSQTRAIESIRHKKDSALARLAIAESKLKALVSGTPMEKQSEIAEHIKQIRNKAKQLQKEAVTELENAKQEVEKIILKTDKQTE